MVLPRQSFVAELLNAQIDMRRLNVTICPKILLPKRLYFLFFLTRTFKLFYATENKHNNTRMYLNEEIFLALT